MVAKDVSKDSDFSRPSISVDGNTKGVLHDFADEVPTVAVALVEIAAVCWLAHFVSLKGDVQGYLLALTAGANPLDKS